MTATIHSFHGRRVARLAKVYEAALERIVHLAGHGAEPQAILEAAEDALAEKSQGRGLS